MSDTGVVRTLRCRGCHRRLEQVYDKAVGTGEWQLVWSDLDGEWVCFKTGDEHEPNRDRETA